MAKDLTSGQAASYLGVHIDTLLKMAKSGRIPFYTIGKGTHRRFRREDLDRIKQGT